MRIKNILNGNRVRHQLFRHLLIGGTGFLFNWLMFSYIRTFTNLSTLYSTLLVHTLLLVLIFPLQKFFTFQRKEQDRAQMLRFVISDAAYIMLDFLLAAIFIDRLSMLPIIGKGCGLAILTPISFILQRYWVFRKS